MWQTMNSNFFASASQANHDVIIGTRFLAYKGADSRTSARILDCADPLGVTLMTCAQANDEQVALFRVRLQDIEVNFPGIGNLVAHFDERMSKPNARRELAVREA